MKRSTLIIWVITVLVAILTLEWLTARSDLRLEALESRMGLIEGKLDRMQEQLDYIEANVHPPANR